MFLHVKEVIKVLSRGGLSKWAALKAVHVHRPEERGAEQCAQVDEEKRGTEMGNRKTKMEDGVLRPQARKRQGMAGTKNKFFPEGSEP